MSDIMMRKLEHCASFALYQKKLGFGHIVVGAIL